MTTEKHGQFLPDYASPPGDTIAELLEYKGMTQVELAERLGRTPKAVNELIKGKAPLSPELAIALERALDVPSRLWLNRESQYQETLARLREREALAKHVAWLEHVPYSEMVRLHWIPRRADLVDRLLEVLKFFGAATPAQCAQRWHTQQVSFRRSHAFEQDSWAVAAWLRQGELQAEQIDCAVYDHGRFREVLTEIRALTTEPPPGFRTRAESLCASAGVALAFVPPLPKVRASGATRWLTPSKALIQLSLRHKTDDHLWFTFFHEVCHILRHGKRQSFLDVVGKKDSPQSPEEEEANVFARDLLVPPKDWEEFVAQGSYTAEHVREFAEAQGIAPGIIVGRLQFEKRIEFRSALNHLKRRFVWLHEQRSAAPRV